MTQTRITLRHFENPVRHFEVTQIGNVTREVTQVQPVGNPGAFGRPVRLCHFFSY